MHPVTVTAASLRLPLLTVAAGLLLGGCTLTRPAVVKERYLLQAAPPAPAMAPAAAAAHPGTLRLNPVAVAAPYAGTSLVVRLDEFRYERDFYHEFLVAPRDMITERTAAWLAARRVFAGVQLAGSSLPPDVELGGFVSEFYGDLRPGRPPEAVLTVQFVLTDIRTAPAKRLWQDTFTRRVPLTGKAPAEIVRGMDAALAAVLTDLAAALQAAPAAAAP